MDLENFPTPRAGWAFVQKLPNSATVQLQSFTHFEPGHAKHVDIQQDEIRSRLACEPKFNFAGSGKPLIGLLRQHPTLDLNRRRVVINQQQANLTR